MQMEWDGNASLRGQVGCNGSSAGLGENGTETGWGWVRMGIKSVGWMEMDVISVPMQT